MAAGKPEDLMEMLATHVNTPKKLDQAGLGNSAVDTPLDGSTQDGQDVPSSASKSCLCDVCRQIGPKPEHNFLSK